MAGDKKIKELPLLDTSANNDIIIVSDTSEVLDADKTKGQTKQNFLKEVYTALDQKEGDKKFQVSFIAQAVVTVNHNLGKLPSVTIIDTTGEEVIGAVNHTSENSLTVSFSFATGGTVYCN